MCHNIVLERITNYYKKGIEMYTNKKRILNITFIFPIHKYDWKLKQYLPRTKEDAIYYSMQGRDQETFVFVVLGHPRQAHAKKGPHSTPHTHTPGKPSLSLSLDEFTFPFMRKINKYNGLIQAMASKKVGCLLLQLPSCIYYVLHITSQRHQNPSYCILAVFTPHLSVVT